MSSSSSSSAAISSGSSAFKPIQFTSGTGQSTTSSAASFVFRGSGFIPITPRILPAFFKNGFQASAVSKTTMSSAAAAAAAAAGAGSGELLSRESPKISAATSFVFGGLGVTNTPERKTGFEFTANSPSKQSSSSSGHQGKKRKRSISLERSGPPEQGTLTSFAKEKSTRVQKEVFDSQEHMRAFIRAVSSRTQQSHSTSSLSGEAGLHERFQEVAQIVKEKPRSHYKKFKPLFARKAIEAHIQSRIPAPTDEGTASQEAASQERLIAEGFNLYRM